MATAIIPVGPASVYLSRPDGIGKLITESTVKGLNEEDYRYLVREEIERVSELSPPETLAFILPSVTLETSSQSLQFMEELVVHARKELGNWHRQENIRFKGAGKKQQANQGRDAEEFRICVAGVNSANRGKPSHNLSGFKGVTWYKLDGRWLANITVNGKKIHLGYYDNPEEAHAAYCQAAKEHFGEFACTE